MWYPESGYLRHQYGPSLLTTDGRANIQAQQGDGSPCPMQIEKVRKVRPHPAGAPGYLGGRGKKGSNQLPAWPAVGPCTPNRKGRHRHPETNPPRTLRWEKTRK